MATFTAEGLSYDDATALIQSLKAQGIEANITVGGVSIWGFTPDKLPLVQQICKDTKAYLKPGYSSSQEQFMLNSENGWEQAERVTGNAISLVKEFKP